MTQRLVENTLQTVAHFRLYQLNMKKIHICSQQANRF